MGNNIFRWFYVFFYTQQLLTKKRDNLGFNRDTLDGTMHKNSLDKYIFPPTGFGSKSPILLGFPNGFFLGLCEIWDWKNKAWCTFLRFLARLKYRFIFLLTSEVQVNLFGFGEVPSLAQTQKDIRYKAWSDFFAKGRHFFIPTFDSHNPDTIRYGYGYNQQNQQKAWAV